MKKISQKDHLSISVQEYFSKLNNKVEKIYKIASEARKKGFDPSFEVEIPIAKDIADRVEGLIGPEGVGEKIRAFEKQNLSREMVAFKIAEEICEGKLGTGSKEFLAEQAIRTSLAVITESITAAPLEGIAKIKIKQNDDGSDYLAIYYAGPIRSAGGTAAGMSVLLADFIRKKLGIGKYKPMDREIERYVEEIELYNRISHLQLPTTKQEQRFAAQHLPVEISGEPTDKVEVTGNRDLRRIETNRLRGGACLVFNDGIVGRAKKIYKRVQENNLDGWDWLEELIEIHETTGVVRNSEIEKHEADMDVETISNLPRNDEFKDPTLLEVEEGIASDTGYIKDVIAGRPVFAHPSEKGGFRIRYGRSRTTGLAGMGIHPALMGLVRDFLACGTHVRTERPGKGAIVMPVDTLHPPIVKLKNGDVVKVNSYKEAKELEEQVAEILFLGDMLYGVGEFNQNNSELIPSGYCEEWWSQELKEHLTEFSSNNGRKLTKELEKRLNEFFIKPQNCIPSPDEAIKLSRLFSIPLHPEYTYHWSDISTDDYIILREYIFNEAFVQNDELIIPFNENIKYILERICIPHKVKDGKIHFEQHSLPFLLCLGIKDDTLAPIKNVREKVIDVINELSDIKIRDKCPIYSGARMGRPEKAKDRRMKPPVHMLFPIGEAGGRLRKLLSAAEEKQIEIELVRRKCPNCGQITHKLLCEKCSPPTTTIQVKYCSNCKKECKEDKCPDCGRQTDDYSLTLYPLGKEITNIRTKLGASFPTTIKAVKKLMNKRRFPELLDKGILRAKHGIYVYRDGTVRFDATDAILTHFRPIEIGITIPKLREIGYTTDIDGNILESPEQLVEMKIQDIVLNIEGGRHLVKTANFIDELLEKVYGLPKYYKAKEPSDLIGHIIIGLAPHTSAGIVGRLIGFTQAKVNFAHPYWHAAKRRNCLSGSEKIILWDNNKKRIIHKTIEEIVENQINMGARQEVVDDYGTLAIENLNPSWQVFSIDESTQKPIFQPIKHWVKGTSRQWIEIQTNTGRTIRMTPNHNALLWNKNSQVFTKSKAAHLKVGDLIPILKEPQIPVVLPPSYINILETFSHSLPNKNKFQEFKHQIRLRNAADWMKEKLLQFSKNHTQQRSISNYNNKYFQSPIKEYLVPFLPSKPIKNPLSSHWYCSIPLSHLEVLNKLGVFHWDEIPHDAKLGMARDNHTVSPYLPLNSDLMRLIGYLIAEGYIRDEKSCYQINFSVPNIDLREHVKTLIESILNSIPYYKKDNHQLIHSGRIHAYLFAYAFGIGKKALDKRIPSFIYTLPKDYKFSFLSAIIDGDGSIIPHSNRTTIYTANYELAQDYTLLLMSLGIFSRISKVKGGRYGDAILRRYKKLGIKPKQDNPLYHINIQGKENEFLFDNILLKHKQKQDNIYLITNKKLPQSQNFEKIGTSIIADKIKKVRNITSIENSYCLEVQLEESQSQVYHNFATTNLVTMNCDGDEDSILLALDAFLNFSKEYLPNIRGGQMDAPLILVANINPHEVDDESHNVDTTTKYPLEFYEATLNRVSAKEVLPLIDLISNRLADESAYEGFLFSHETSKIFDGPESTSYKNLKTMDDKVRAQLFVASRIRAVDVRDVATKIVVNHFIPDLIGNLRRFGAQKIRCTNCNKTYRRIPLKGICTKCGSDSLNLTVHVKSVTKYFLMASQLVQQYDLSPYLKNRLEVLKYNFKTLFGDIDEKHTDSKTEVKQVVKLQDYFLKYDSKNK